MRSAYSFEAELSQICKADKVKTPVRLNRLLMTWEKEVVESATMFTILYRLDGILMRALQRMHFSGAYKLQAVIVASCTEKDTNYSGHLVQFKM